MLTGLSFIFYAMPSFLLGTLLILYFAIDIKWFPVGSSRARPWANILGDPRGLVLPEITLAAITIASFSRYMRSSMMEAMTEDYVRTARAKGAGPRRVLYVHALRNAIIPIVTLLGLSIPAIVSGAVITETVFNYPGDGAPDHQAAINTDIPLLLGTALVATIGHRGRLAAGRHPLCRRRPADPLCPVIAHAIAVSPTPRTRRPVPLPPADPGRVLGMPGSAPAVRASRSPDPKVARPPPGELSVRSRRVFIENKLAVIGLAVIIFMVLFCSLGRSSTTPTR